MIEVIRRSAFYQRLTATQTEEPENITDLLDDVRTAIQNHKTTQQHPATPNRAFNDAIDSLYQSEQPVEEVIEIISARCDEMHDRLMKLEQEINLSKDSLKALEKQKTEQIEAYQVAAIQDDEAPPLWSQVAETQQKIDSVRIKLEAFEVGQTELKETIGTYDEVYQALFVRHRMNHMKNYHDHLIRTVGADFVKALTLYRHEVNNLGIGYRPNDEGLISDNAIDYMIDRLSKTFNTETTTEEAH